jgi:homoserine dehydrogenase
LRQLRLGTVGGGVVNVLAKNQTEIKRRTGTQVQVTHAAVRDMNKSRICSTDGIQLTQDLDEIVNND